jgi:hypothetical protein
MTDKEILKEIKKLADAMYNAAQYLTTDASRLHKAMDEYHQFIIHEWREEPVSDECIYNRTLEERQRSCKFCSAACQARIKESVSEGLDDAAFDYAESCKYDEGEKLLCVEHFKAGARWQKQQDQETIELAEDHAMLAGMGKMKEEMMTKSIEAVVSQVPCSNEIILYNPSSVDKYYLPQEMNKLGLNKGDKVKLVIIKND